LRIAVSRATEEDVYALAEISSEVAEEGVVKQFKPEEAKGLLSDEKYYIAVGKLNKEVAGYALSTYSWGKLHILDLAVRKDRRRMGVGKMLVKHLISHASESGLSEVYCEVKARNIPALNFFTGLGFRFRVFSTLVEEGFYGLHLPIETRLSGLGWRLAKFLEHNFLVANLPYKGLRLVETPLSYGFDFSDVSIGFLHFVFKLVVGNVAVVEALKVEDHHPCVEPIVYAQILDRYFLSL